MKSSKENIIPVNKGVLTPVIGITPHYVHRKKPKLPYFFLYRPYVKAVEEQNAIPLIIPILTKSSLINEILAIVDGVVISGGGPTLNKKSQTSSLRVQNPKRYVFERELIKKAYAKEIPLLGICRGHQTMSQVLGGKTWLNIYKHQKQNNRSKKLLEHRIRKGKESFHYININKNTKLFEILKRKRLLVNSTHKQALLTPPPGFIVSARADDNVIEAVESKTHPFCIWVQFHAERLVKEQAVFKNLLKEFVNSARKYRLTKTF